MTGISHPGAIRTGTAYYFSSGAVYCSFSGQTGDSEKATVSGFCGKEVFFSLDFPGGPAMSGEPGVIVFLLLVSSCAAGFRLRKKGGNESVAFSKHPRQVMGGFMVQGNVPPRFPLLLPAICGAVPECCRQ